MRRESLTTTQVQAILQMYAEGAATTQIASVFGFKSHVSILSVLKQHGVKCRPASVTMRGKQNARKHLIQADFFQRIQSEKQAYFLGILFADGWVTKTGVIGLSLVDPEVVVGFQDAVGSTVPVRIRPPKSPKHQPAHEITFSCAEMARDLSMHGCVPRKSLTLEFPPLPPSLTHHFLRGYWDGDGWVMKDKKSNLRVGMCGSKPLLQAVVEWFHKQGLPEAKVHPHGRIFRFEFHGNKLAATFRQLLFRDATLAMVRKKLMLFDDITVTET